MEGHRGQHVPFPNGHPDGIIHGAAGTMIPLLAHMFSPPSISGLPAFVPASLPFVEAAGLSSTMPGLLAREGEGAAWPEAPVPPSALAAMPAAETGPGESEKGSRARAEQFQLLEREKAKPAAVSAPSAVSLPVAPASASVTTLCVCVCGRGCKTYRGMRIHQARCDAYHESVNASAGSATKSGGASSAKSRSAPAKRAKPAKPAKRAKRAKSDKAVSGQVGGSSLQGVPPPVSTTPRATAAHSKRRMSKRAKASEWDDYCTICIQVKLLSGGVA